MRHVDLSPAMWRKSSYSGGQGQCVEVAVIDRVVAMRDSKNPDGPALVFSSEGWGILELTIRRGEFPRRI